MTETETPAPTAREACPFCGGVSAGSLSSAGFDEIYVICDHCGCDGPVGSTEAEALRLWNARAEAATLRAEVARLKAALEWHADPERERILRRLAAIEQEGGA